jgi:Ca2+-transporting ATPase
VAFHEVIIDPASSIAFEVEEVDPEIMKRKPRRPRSGIFSRSDLLIALLQGLSVFLAVFFIFFNSIDQGVSEERIRSLTFTTLVISNVLLILVNRSRSLTIWETFVKRRNAALPWIIGGAILLLVVLLNVRPVSDAFDLAPLEVRDYLTLLFVTLLSLSWYEVMKVVRRRTSHW